MAKYRKKPVVIDAVQWNGFIDGPHDLRIHPMKKFLIDDNDNQIRLGMIDTLEGGMEVTPGDWIITGIKGERYPCKPDIFKATYDKVE